MASILLGIPGNVNWSIYNNQPKYTSSYYAGFIQDTYKILPTLTLNLGLRYEVDMPRAEANGNTSNINLGLANPGAGGLPGAPAISDCSHTVALSTTKETLVSVALTLAVIFCGNEIRTPGSASYPVGMFRILDSVTTSWMG